MQNETTFNNKNIKIVKTIVLMTIFIIVTKLLALFRDGVLAFTYGTSDISDAYIIALSIPTVLFAAIGKSISSSFIPMYIDLDKKDKSVGSKFLFKVLIYGLSLCTVIFAFVEIFPNFIVKLFANGFDDSTEKICVDILQIGAFSIFSMFLHAIFSSLAMSKKHYLATSIVSLPLNIILILAIFFSSKTSYLVLGYGISLAFLSEFLFLVPFLYKDKIKFKVSLRFDSNLKQMLIMLFPILIGSTAAQINHIIDKTIASSLVVGSISALNYSSTINVAIQEVFVTGLLNIVFVEFSRKILDDSIFSLKNDIKEIISILKIVLIPIAFFSFFNSNGIIKCLYFRGSFDDNSLQMTSVALSFYSIGIYFVSFRDILVKIFYANKNSKIPAFNSLISISINIILNICLAKIMGIAGIALATSVSSIVSCVILYFNFKKKYYSFLDRKSILLLIKVVFCSVLSVLLNIMFTKIMTQTKLNSNFLFIISGILFCVAYFFLLLLLKEKRLLQVFKSLFRKG